MQYYRFTGVWDSYHEPTENRAAKALRRELATKTDSFNLKNTGKVYMFISSLSESSVIIGAVMMSRYKQERILEAFSKKLGMELSSDEKEEITFDSLQNMLRSAHYDDFIQDDDTVLRKLGLYSLRRYGFEFSEVLIDGLDKDEIYKNARRLLMDRTLLPELGRIYASAPKNGTYGHPVHYMVMTDDGETRRVSLDSLLNGLFSQERIRSKRVSVVNIEDDYFPEKSMRSLFESSRDGAIVINCCVEDEEDGEVSHGWIDYLEQTCAMICEYSDTVLSLICMPRECKRIKKLLFDYMPSLSFIEISEDPCDVNRAEAFLRSLASGRSVRADKKLFSKLEEGAEYLTPELRDMFAEWYQNKLRSSIFPQYKDISQVRRKVMKSAPEGSAYDELQKMVGIEAAKKVMLQAIDYYKALKVFSDKGFKADHPSMHMVFTGNPGTAKTTTARLFARIMKENGLLSRGKLVEVGRSDLVGKYVGWTARIVKSCFKEAQGGVLFIDEAYSLVDGHSGSYGDEAINTIVQEMENHREDVVVIFAGYPDKMEEFLQTNPGLRSRIAFHVPFPDYSTEDLCGIAKLIAEEKSLLLSDDALLKLHGIFDIARKETDFGNGRYIINILEQARMKQAVRLLNSDCDLLKRSDIMTIKAEDIECPEGLNNQTRRQIGFAS